MSEKYKVGGYVKLAKLWERSRESAIDYHERYYTNKYLDSEEFELVGVYIDITGFKETSKRPAMVRLLRDCAYGKINCIAAQTKGYLAANTKEFCYLIKFLSDLEHRIDILTEDDVFNINTIVNEDMQYECLVHMADDFVYLNPPDYIQWLEKLQKAEEKLESQEVN